MGPVLKRVALLTALLAINACSLGSPEKAVTGSDRAFARHFFGLLRDEQYDSVYALLAPETKTERARGVLPMVGALLKEASLDTLRLVGFTQHTSAGTRDLELQFELPTAEPKRWILASVHTRTVNERVVVFGFSTSPSEGPREGVNRFTFAGRSVVLWLALVLVMLAWALYRVRASRARSAAAPQDGPLTI